MLNFGEKLKPIEGFQNWNVKLQNPFFTKKWGCFQETRALISKEITRLWLS